MAINSSGEDLRPAALPLHIFHDLLSPSRARADPIDAAALRRRLSSRLRANRFADHAADTSTTALTARDVLALATPPALLRALDPCLTRRECVRLLSRVHRAGAVRPRSATDVLRASRGGAIPTGLPTLDERLGGGIPMGALAEVVGRAGAGKTHLAQQLCAMAVEARGGGSIYVDAERKLSVARLREIAVKRFADERDGDGRRHRQGRTRDVNALAMELCENVSIHSVSTTRELLDTLDRLDGEIARRNSEASSFERGGIPTNGSARRLPVRLIVVDSIAAPLRRDFDIAGPSPGAAARRAAAVFQIAKRLKRLADDRDVAVVVVNQVGAGHAVGGNDSLRNNNLDVGDGEFVASLGTAWQHCVSTRIALEQEEDPHRLRRTVGGDERSVVRAATLAKSLVSRRTRVRFELRDRGLCEVTSA